MACLLLLAQVQGIPTLAVFDGNTGELLTLKGRRDVTAPEAQKEPLTIIKRW